MFCKQNQQQKNFFLRGNFRPLPNKNLQMGDHFFSLIFPKDYKSLKFVDIPHWEVGAKRPLNGTSKVNTHIDTHTNTQTHIWDSSACHKSGPILGYLTQTLAGHCNFLGLALDSFYLTNTSSRVTLCHIYIFSAR